MECVNVTPNEALTAEQLLQLKVTIAKYLPEPPTDPADITNQQIQEVVCEWICNESEKEQRQYARKHVHITPLH